MGQSSFSTWNGSCSALKHMTAFSPPLDVIQAKRSFSLSDFDFHLPSELIAQHPATERSSSQLLDGSGPMPVDRVFKDLPQQMQSGDLLVFNDTQVIKARIFGEKSSGGKVELLIERVLPGHRVVAHMKVSKKPPIGATLYMGRGPDAFLKQSETGFEATLIGRWPDEKGALFCFEFSAEPHALMAQYGHMPLPPYIERQYDGSATESEVAEDEARYQTVFARHPGAVAAPTAALHFDDALLPVKRKGRRHRECHFACGCRHLPARENRKHCRTHHACRVVRHSCIDAACFAGVQSTWR